MKGPRRRFRRLLVWAAAGLALLVAAWFLVVPMVLGPVVASTVEAEWGGRAEVDAATWTFGRTLRLRGLRVYDGENETPMVTCERARAVLENVPVGGDPGLLLDLVLEGAVLDFEGERLTTVRRVRYTREGSAPARIAFSGVDATVDPAKTDRWVRAVTRIVGAPGIAPKGDGPLLAGITAERSQIVLALDVGDAARKLPLRNLAARLRPTGAKEMAIESITADVCRGQLTTFGSVDWRGTTQYHAQVNLRNVEIGAVATALGTLPDARGTIDVFLDVHAPDHSKQRGWPIGSGWIEGKNVWLWKAPVLSSVLRILGLMAKNDDVLERLSGKMRLDRGRLYVSELLGYGQPVSFFMNGSAALDGTDVDGGVVPRFLGAKGVTSVPVVGKPTQLVIDLLAGTAVQLRVTGPLDDVAVSVQPLSVISEPIRAFFSLFRSTK